MSARVFLELLLKQYRDNYLHTIANMLTWALDALNIGDPLGALASLQRAEKQLLAEMKAAPHSTNWHVRDLALLRAVKQMIEQDHILF